MNKKDRSNNSWKICPECGVPHKDGHRHREGYKDSKPRCARQHKRKDSKITKKGKPIPYSRGG